EGSLRMCMSPQLAIGKARSFRRRAKLSAHLVTHTGERRFPCDKCGIAFKGKYNLQKHNRRYHSDPNEQATATTKKCTECDFTCNSPIQLRVHKRQEHKVIKRKKFECKYCQKRFSNSTLLDVHMVVHTGAKKFECEICNKKFSQKPHLQSIRLYWTFTWWCIPEPRSLNVRFAIRNFRRSPIYNPIY
ncbi:zinc finger protein, partial [Oryctes borbonicus]